MSAAGAGRRGTAFRLPALAAAFAAAFWGAVCWATPPASAASKGGLGADDLLSRTLEICRTATAADLSRGVRVRLSGEMAAAQLRLDAGVEVVKTLERLQLECEGALAVAQPSSQERSDAVQETPVVAPVAAPVDRPVADKAAAGERSPDNRTAARAALAACETALGREAGEPVRAAIEASPAGPAASAAAFEALRTLCAVSAREVAREVE